MPNLIGQSLGRYHILEQLGEGGMATVYKAYDTRLETDVAVKVIRTENLPQNGIERALKRFEREAKSLAKLTHPNIVKVTDYGEYDGKPFLVMPYLPGGTLKQLLNGTPMPWQDVCRLMLPIAQALEYAHEQGLIHRDVKPSNILLTEKGLPMLGDFGIAKILELDETTALTGTGMGVGTPEYMAPEQWTGKTVAQSDIYSLGIVLYELVTGRKPYQADTPAAILLKQATDPLPRPRKFAPNLPELVERVLFKALAKTLGERYQNAGDFAAALDKLISVQPLKSRNATPGKERQEDLATIDSFSPDQPAPANAPVQQKKSDLEQGNLLPIRGRGNLKVWVGGGIAVIAMVILMIVVAPGLWIKNTQSAPANLPLSTITQSTHETPVTVTPPSISSSQINQPTQKPAETAVGKLVFSADFENGSSDNFNVEFGNWSVVKDETGNKVLESQVPEGALASIGFGPSDLKNFIVEFRIKLKNGIVSPCFQFRKTAETYYALLFNQTDPELAFNYVDNKGWNWHWISSKTGFSLEKDTWYDVKIDMRGNQYKIYINGIQYITGMDSRLTDGNFAFSAGPKNCQFDDIRVWSIP